MSSTKEQVTVAMKEAMRSKSKDRLNVIRLITSAVKQQEVDTREDVSEQQMLMILDKMQKQRRESITQYHQAGRTDLVDKEQFEIDIIQEFLPEQLSEDEVKSLIASVIDDTGANSIKDMGKVMSALKPKVQGKGDMSKISILIKEKLSQA